MSQTRSNTILPLLLLLIVAVILGGYTYYWFKAADFARDAYVVQLASIEGHPGVTPPQISGFPGKMVISKDRESIGNASGVLTINDLRITSWPFPNMPVQVKTGSLALGSQEWDKGFRFASFAINATPTKSKITIHDSTLNQGTYQLKVTGVVDLSTPDFIKPDLTIRIRNPRMFLASLEQTGFVDARAGQMVGSALASMRDPKTGETEIPVYVQNTMLFVGPLPIVDLAPQRGPIAAPPGVQRKRVKPETNDTGDVDMQHPQEMPAAE